MKFKNSIFSIIILSIIFLSSCVNDIQPGVNIKTVEEQKINEPEIDVLLKYIKNSGDYINSKGVPNMISSENVNDNLSNYFIFDLRSHQEYIDGHIDGAVNVKASEILDYLDKNVSASDYDKLVIACHTGQSASYVTSILRLVGYNNAYAMKYGMSAWNKSLDKWSKQISNKYATKLETKENTKGAKMLFPIIKTGQTCGAQILEARAKTVLNTPFKKLKINADRAFSDSSFYIINYWPKDKYSLGHIPGAIQYTPKQDLSDTTFLNTLPTDKKILVYAYTGQNAAFTIAYLRLLGYNAFTLGLGANSFMHKTLVDKNWYGFIATEKVNNFRLVKGEKPSDKKANVGVSSAGKTKAKKKVVRRKKKEVEGGCG